ncbi:MAG: hypothetical protein HY644_06635 [Acidobacteria bacterium]|nr:hypothetical protein [Acidobacteriota bacterium]
MRHKVLIAAFVSTLLAGVFLTSSAQQMGKMETTKLPPKVEKELDQIRQNLKAVKSEMPGLACCIGPACNFCPLVASGCPCGMNVRTEKGVCGECFDGWHAGQGRMPGVKAHDVKHWNAAMLDTMFKARAKYFSPGQ